MPHGHCTPPPDGSGAGFRIALRRDWNRSIPPEAVRQVLAATGKTNKDAAH